MDAPPGSPVSIPSHTSFQLAGSLIQYINHWKAITTQTQTVPNGRGLAGCIFYSCIYITIQIAQTFRKPPFILSEYQPDFLRLFQKLALWGDSHKALSGKLDQALHLSKDIRSQVLALLRSISFCLSQQLLRWVLETELELNKVLKCSEIHSHLDRLVTSELIADQDLEDEISEESDQDSDETLSGSEGPAISRQEYTVKQIQETLAADIEDLHHLSQSIQDQVPDRDYDDTSPADVISEGNIDPWFPFGELIRTHYPQGEQESIARLGGDNFHRYKRLMQDLFDSSTDLDGASFEKDDISSEIISIFHDSGRGTSIPDSKHHSQTAALSTQGSHFPPLLAGSGNRNGVKCELCDERIVIECRGNLKRHILNHLAPYACPFPICTSTQLQSWESLTTHLATHQTSRSAENRCLLCQGQLPKDIEGAVDHIAKHLEEIFLSSVPNSLRPTINSHSEHTVVYRPDDNGAGEPFPHGPDSLIIGGLRTQKITHYGFQGTSRDIEYDLDQIKCTEVERPVQHWQHSPVPTGPNSQLTGSALLATGLFSIPPEGRPPQPAVLNIAEPPFSTVSPADLHDSTATELTHLLFQPQSRIYPNTYTNSPRYLYSSSHHPAPLSRNVWDNNIVGNVPTQQSSFSPRAAGHQDYSSAGLLPSSQHMESITPVGRHLNEENQHYRYQTRNKTRRTISTGRACPGLRLNDNLGSAVVPRPFLVCSSGETPSFDLNGPPRQDDPDSDPEECSQCSQKFDCADKNYNPGNKKRHRRYSCIATISDPLVCNAQTCEMVFKRSDARLNHERKHHPELNRAPPERR